MTSGKECMTIVVPVFNRPTLILRCLDSLMAQTYRPLRVLVVDNGSTDSTPEAVRGWIDSHADDDFSVELLHDTRKGAAYARQTGLDHTVTDKVMFFDSDDAMRPECVAYAMDSFSLNPAAEIVAWPVAVHFSEGVRITHSLKGNLLERHLVHAVLRTLGYAVKTEYLRQSGGWRGEFPNWNDFETGVRLLLREPVVEAVNRPLVDIYPQKESITGTSFSAKAGKWEFSLDAIEESIKKSGRPDVERLLNIVNYRKVILAASYAKEDRMDLALPLYREAMSRDSRRCRLLYRFSFYWTKARMRGAFSIVGRWF